MSDLKVSRRSLLKGLGAGALSYGFLNIGTAPARAQISPTGRDIAAYYRFSIGDFNMTVVSDNAGQLPAAFVGANQPEADMQAYFANLNLLNPDTGTIPNTFLILVLQTNDMNVVFDTGNGAGVGKLVPTLEALGIPADSVNAVVMSHWHPDHISGLSTDDVPTFPNATVYFPQAEYDFLQAAPDDVVGGAKAKLAPVEAAGMLSLYAAGTGVIPGVTAISTPGHTPGHTSFVIESNGSRMIHFVDSVISAYATPNNPEWFFGFDADPEQAVASRQMILEMAASEGIPVMGYHFPFPGTGHIIPDGDGSYRFIPVAF